MKLVAWIQISVPNSSNRFGSSFASSGLDRLGTTIFDNNRIITTAKIASLNVMIRFQLVQFPTSCLKL
jgi:hypothetical protein